MPRRRIDDNEVHAQFVTFSCYRRRRLLDHARARQIIMGLLAVELDNYGVIRCGFVVMPDHVHAIVWLPETGRLSQFMQVRKSRSSRQLKEFIRGRLREYANSIGSCRFVFGEDLPCQDTPHKNTSKPLHGFAASLIGLRSCLVLHSRFSGSASCFSAAAMA
jgi:REP element-mobilizing transposase RayT